MVTRVRAFGIEMDPLSLDEASAVIHQWIDEPHGACRYVVTPNVDHTVLLTESQELRAAYDEASLVLADGMPIVLACRWLGRPVPERVAGSDLVPAVFSAADPQRGLRVYLLGAAPGVAERAADQIHAQWPAVRVVGCHSPPLGFEKLDVQNAEIVERVNAAAADLLILGLGAPKQEVWIQQRHRQLRVAAAICAGATIDFLAGERSRAPVWMQRVGLEWLFRIGTEPNRLFWRYARDAWVFPQLLWREYWSAAPQ